MMTKLCISIFSANLFWTLSSIAMDAGEVKSLHVTNFQIIKWLNSFPNKCARSGMDLYSRVNVAMDELEKNDDIDLVNYRLPDSGDSLLHVVVRFKEKEEINYWEENKQGLVSYLIGQKNLNVNAKNNYGQTPMMIAAILDRPVALNHLLWANADPNLVSNAGETALELAITSKNVNSIFILLAAAKNNKDTLIRASDTFKQNRLKWEKKKRVKYRKLLWSKKEVPRDTSTISEKSRKCEARLNLLELFVTHEHNKQIKALTNEHDHNGYTPLIKALRSADHFAAIILLKFGASPLPPYPKDLNPFIIAKESKFSEIRAIVPMLRDIAENQLYAILCWRQGQAKLLAYPELPDEIIKHIVDLAVRLHLCEEVSSMREIGTNQNIIF